MRRSYYISSTLAPPPRIQKGWRKTNKITKEAWLKHSMGRVDYISYTLAPPPSLQKTAILPRNAFHACMEAKAGRSVSSNASTASSEEFLGRFSPCDLGYHTLTPTEAPPPPLPKPNEKTTAWGAPPPEVQRPNEKWGGGSSFFSEAVPKARLPLGGGELVVPATPSLITADVTTEKLVATFKGKKPPRRPSPFDRLPDSVIVRVFSFLASNELCVSARVCRRWYFLVWEPQLWTSVVLKGERIQVDKGLKTLFRLLCRDSPTLCLSVDRIRLSGCSRLSDKGLSCVALKCPELRVLEVKGCARVTGRGVADVVARCAALEKLDLTGCTAVTSVHPLSAPTPLRHLDLTDCSRLDDCSLELICRSCPQLTHLYLRRCVLLTDDCLKRVANYCRELRELSVSDCVQLTDFGLYELAKLGANMRYLSVAKCDRISDAGVKQIAKHCYKLRYLNVRGCEAVSDSALEVIARSCTKLRALDVGKCDITDRGLRLISHHCPNLRKLSVKSCELITDEGIQGVAYYCRGLQQLNVQDCPITLDGYRTVKKFCRKCIIEHTNPGFN
ncbi:hypothetical protein JTE90_018577 [Oedothorax gibbosus]|uniref:F-box/LRR-repeat protein 7 n=1 Tax=Oedothorax gibbosus TaxID=931172 RepID=A0AAV6U516_9ARAC|nr:hypothetical protein JTE90_018577 [Oedothorax gibbosus]